MPVAAIDPADIAAVATAVLADPPATPGGAYELSGPEALTPGEQVAILARALERPLRYEAVPDDQARAEMAGNTPPPLIEAFFRFYSERRVRRRTDRRHRAALTGRAPRRFQEWARDHVDAFARS